MDKIIVKKKKAKFDKVPLKDHHPNPNSLNHNLTWSTKEGKDGTWILSVQVTINGYDGVDIINTYIVDAPSSLHNENQLEAHIKKQLRRLEDEKQEEEVDRIRKEIVIKSDEYEDE